MKRIILFLFTILLSLNIFAEGNNSVVLHFKNGASQIYSIREAMTIREASDSIVLNSNTIRIAYGIADVKSYNFISDYIVDSGIQQIMAEGQGNIRFSREGNILAITGLPRKSRICVLSINGIEQFPPKSYSDGKASVDISGLVKGVYIIHISGIDNAPSIRIII